MGEFSGSRVLVTGGSGFIGRSVVRALLDAEAKVTVVDRVCHPDPDVRTVHGDLCDPQIMDAAVDAGTDLIVHLAAVTSVLRSVEDPVGVFATNVAATQALLELARQRDVGSFIMASTNAVVGNVGHQVINEDTPLHPLTPYGSTKAAGEMLLSAYTSSYGITGTALRLANVYGPGMTHRDSFIPRLMRAAAASGGVKIYGDGAQLRDFVHVADVVQAVFLAWRTGHTGPLTIGSGRSDSVTDLIERAREATGRAIPAEHVDAPGGEMPAVILDIARARSLGYEPTHDLRSGLATVWPDFA